MQLVGPGELHDQWHSLLYGLLEEKTGKELAQNQELYLLQQASRCDFPHCSCLIHCNLEARH